jgi:hypothetical protein
MGSVRGVSFVPSGAHSRSSFTPIGKSLSRLTIFSTFLFMLEIAVDVYPIEHLNLPRYLHPYPWHKNHVEFNLELSCTKGIHGSFSTIFFKYIKQNYFLLIYKKTPLQ